MKIDAAIIKFPNKDIARYEIYIEAYHYNNLDIDIHSVTLL